VQRMEFKKTKFPTLQKSEEGYCIHKTGLDVVRYTALTPTLGRGWLRDKIGVYKTQKEAEKACEEYENNNL
jgi:hypothetical protein